MDLLMCLLCHPIHIIILSEANRDSSSSVLSFEQHVDSRKRVCQKSHSAMKDLVSIRNNGHTVDGTQKKKQLEYPSGGLVNLEFDICIAIQHRIEGTYGRASILRRIMQSSCLLR